MTAYLRSRSKIRSISLRDAYIENSETDLKPYSGCNPMKSFMRKYISAGIFTSLYKIAIGITCFKNIKIKCYIHVETFIRKQVIRYVCLIKWRLIK